MAAVFFTRFKLEATEGRVNTRSGSIVPAEVVGIGFGRVASEPAKLVLLRPEILREVDHEGGRDQDAAVAELQLLILPAHERDGHGVEVEVPVDDVNGAAVRGIGRIGSELIQARE